MRNRIRTFDIHKTADGLRWTLTVDVNGTPVQIDLTGNTTDELAAQVMAELKRLGLPITKEDIRKNA